MRPFSKGRTTLNPAAAMRISANARTAKRITTASIVSPSRQTLQGRQSRLRLQGLDHETCSPDFGDDDLLAGRQCLRSDGPPLLRLHLHHPGPGSQVDVLDDYAVQPDPTVP